MKQKILDLIGLEAFWASLLVVVFFVWAFTYRPAGPKVEKPVLLPQRVEQLSKICIDNGAYGDYLIIEDSRPRQVICKFSRKIKSQDSKGNDIWTNDIYSYDATELEKESKK